MGTSGAGGGDWLDGASRADLGENLTPLERGLFDTLEAERRKDPAGRFAYLPAVNRDHYTVNQRFHDDKECPGAGFVVAMMVRGCLLVSLVVTRVHYVYLLLCSPIL